MSPIGSVLSSEEIEAFEADPRQWLEAQADDETPYLLAHAMDGVLWGVKIAGRLRLSSDGLAPVPPLGTALRSTTVLHCRLFGPGGEIHIWRHEDSLVGRRIVEANEPTDHFDEDCLLWGEIVERDGGFALMREGEQGLEHRIPSPEGVETVPTLSVRHFVGYEHDMARVIDSRLLTLAYPDQDAD